MNETTLTIHRSALEVTQDRWSALVSGEDTPFQRWEWFDALESSGCASRSSGWQPMHFGLYEREKLVALAPGYLRSDSWGEFVFDQGWARAALQLGGEYYPKLTLAVPFTPVAGRRVLTAPAIESAERERLVKTLLAALARVAGELGLSSVHLLFLTDEEARWARELGWVLRYGVQYQWFKGECRSWGDYLARFDSKKRNKIKRESRAVEAQGISVTTRRGGELGVKDAPLIHALYRKTVDRYLWGRPYLNEKFFIELLSRCPEMLELVEAKVGDSVIAGAFNVADEKRLFGRYWGCFEEREFLHFKVCYYHSIEECLARGVERFEGGAGGEHKLSRGFEPVRTVSAHWVFDQRLDRAVRETLEREREMVEREIEGVRQTMGFRAVMGAREIE